MQCNASGSYIIIGGPTELSVDAIPIIFTTVHRSCDIGIESE